MSLRLKHSFCRIVVNGTWWCAYAVAQSDTLSAFFDFVDENTWPRELLECTLSLLACAYLQAHPCIVNLHLQRAPLRRLGTVGQPTVSTENGNAQTQPAGSVSPEDPTSTALSMSAAAEAAPAPPLVLLQSHPANEEDGSMVLMRCMSEVQKRVSPWERLELESNDNMELVLNEHLERVSVAGARKAIQRMLHGHYHQILPAKLDTEKLMNLKVTICETRTVMLLQRPQRGIQKQSPMSERWGTR